MNLREVVDKYRKLAKGFGAPVALSDFGWPRQETEKVFSALDEDYHISRFLRLTLDSSSEKSVDRTYRINDVPQSHVSIDAGILEIL